jgi:hypothetical protein
MVVPESFETVEVSIRVALRFDAGIVDRCPVTSVRRD